MGTSCCNLLCNNRGATAWPSIAESGVQHFVRHTALCGYQKTPKAGRFIISPLRSAQNGAEEARKNVYHTTASPFSNRATPPNGSLVFSLLKDLVGWMNPILFAFWLVRSQLCCLKSPFQQLFRWGNPQVLMIDPGFFDDKSI